MDRSPGPSVAGRSATGSAVARATRATPKPALAGHAVDDRFPERAKRRDPPQQVARFADRGAAPEPADPTPTISSRQRHRLPPTRAPAFTGCVLSASELQTVRQMARGHSYASAAHESHRATSTVRSLLHTAYARLGVVSIAQALAVCTQVGWLDEVPHDGSIVERADRRVTWAQRLYIEAFDQSLRAGEDPDEQQRTRQLREAALTGMYREAGKNAPWRQERRDPIERLAQDMQRLNPPPDAPSAQPSRPAGHPARAATPM